MAGAFVRPGHASSRSHAASAVVLPEPGAVLGVGEHDEARSLAESGRRGADRGVENSVEGLVGYPLSGERTDHVTAAHDFGEIHPSTLDLPASRKSRLKW